jgi:putative ABC transport system substrate-binding protein
VNVGDPVASGIVPRLNQPGGNTTGFALYEASLGGKWLELLSEIAPGLKRAAIMFNPDISLMFNADINLVSPYFLPSFEDGARSLKVEAITAPVHDEVEIEAAISALGREAGGGLVVTSDAFVVAQSPADHIGGGPQQRTGGLYRI